MAVANVDPITAAKMAKAQKRRADLNSIDPVTRWRAREQGIEDGLEDMGNALVRQAVDAGKAYQRITQNQK